MSAANFLSLRWPVLARNPMNTRRITGLLSRGPKGREELKLLLNDRNCLGRDHGLTPGFRSSPGDSWAGFGPFEGPLGAKS